MICPSQCVCVCSPVFCFVTLCVPVWSVFVPVCMCAHNEVAVASCLTGLGHASGWKKPGGNDPAA